MGIAEILAANIRRLRKQLGISQDALSELIGVSRAMVNYYEAGEVWPRPDVIDTLAKVLKVPVSQLFAKGDAATLPPDLVDAIAAAARACGLKVNGRS